MNHTKSKSSEKSTSSIRKMPNQQRKNRAESETSPSMKAINMCRNLGHQFNKCLEKLLVHDAKSGIGLVKKIDQAPSLASLAPLQNLPYYEANPDELSLIASITLVLNTLPLEIKNFVWSLYFIPSEDTEDMKFVVRSSFYRRKDRATKAFIDAMGEDVIEDFLQNGNLK